MDEARSADREASTEPRPSELHLQFEQVSVALQHLRHTQDSLQDLEKRLSDMTRECAAILERWASSDEKHATAVAELHGRLSEWNDIERRLLNESTSRIHQFERSLQHEWQAIRHSHEEPMRQLDVQTTRIAETCLTAVTQALRGFDQAESRLTAIEQELYREIGVLTREVRDALAELRLSTPQLAPGARQPWSLDNVVRLHNELRAEGDAAPAFAGAGVSGSYGVATMPNRSALALAGVAPIDAEATPSDGATIDRSVQSPASGLTAPPVVLDSPDVPVWRRTPVIAAAVMAVILGGFGVYLETELQTGLKDAAARAEAAERGATEARAQAQREIGAAQRSAEAKLEAARQVAQSAQTLATITAATDLKRFDLAARDPGVTAQVLFSRSTGVALSATRLPAAPPGQTWQLWLVSPGRATSVGTVTADADRTSAVFESPANLPRAVIRAMLTLEPAGGSSQPTGSAYALSALTLAAPQAP
jgi:anti-sigma-K factor RskA